MWTLTGGAFLVKILVEFGAPLCLRSPLGTARPRRRGERTRLELDGPRSVPQDGAGEFFSCR